MRIGFDAKRAIQNNTGLGNYSRYILSILSTYSLKNQYLLFVPKKQENPSIKFILNRKNVSSVFPSGLFKGFAILWRAWGMNKSLKKNNLDLFHGLSNELPFGIKKTGIKSVVTIHDLIFFRYPHYYPLVDRWIYRIKSQYACRKADKIIAASECTKRDIISFFHISEEKIEVIYQGCNPIFKEKVLEEKKNIIREKYCLPSLFLLNVGTIERRKNVLLIVKALSLLPQHIHLVIIGGKTSYQLKVKKYAKKSGLISRLHIFNHILLKDLPAFYQMASIFVYPSFFEGFGIPIVEALMSQIPVIAASGSCLEEVGGKDSLYLHPNKEDEWAFHIQEVLNNKDLTRKMIMSGKEYLNNFSEKKISEKLIQLYHSMH